MACTDQHIRDTILDLLGQREPAATICPSEVARALTPDAWRPLMPSVRKVAFEMARRGKLEIRQQGHAVDPDEPMRGPIRLSRKHD